MPTQSTDVNGGPFGILFTANDQTWKILQGVNVAGTQFGVASDAANSVLKNSGTVSGGSFGALFDTVGGASNPVVKNAKKGEIAGGTAGIGIFRFDGSALVENKGSIEGATFGVFINDYVGSARVVNTGVVKGGIAGIFADDAQRVAVENHGNVQGTSVGIAMTFSGLSSGSVVNTGKIGAAQFGIYVTTSTGSEVKIVNHEGAALEGGAFSIVMGEKLNLKNAGKVDGIVATSAFADKVVNKGKIKGETLLGAGDDVFKNKGDKAKSGMIETGGGNDLVVLGKKADKLLFDSALNAATNVDTVKNFQSGKDRFYLDDDIFSAIGPGTLSSSASHKGTSAADADDRIIYDKSTGALYYDPDGTGGLAQTQFAKLQPGTKLKASDFTVGEYSLPVV